MNVLSKLKVGQKLVALLGLLLLLMLAVAGAGIYGMNSAVHRLSGPPIVSEGFRPRAFPELWQAGPSFALISNLLSLISYPNQIGPGLSISTNGQPTKDFNRCVASNNGVAFESIY